MRLQYALRKIFAVMLFVVMLGACTGKPSIQEENEVPPQGNDTISYPITITHAFGETIIQSKPENVATIAWGNHDVPLALGVVPVGVSKANFGLIDEYGLLPWTAAAYIDLGVSKPVVFDDTDGLDFEAISDSNPDIILAAYSGITQEEYDLLSQIAPVIAYPKFAWQTYWREQTLMNGKAMGLEMEASQLVADTEAFITSKVSQYEAIKGKSAIFTWISASDLGSFYIYLPADSRANYLLDLGLKFPESAKNLAQGVNDFAILVSAENIDLLDDVDIIFTYGDEALLNVMQADPLLGQMPAIKNGSVVLIDSNSAIAASCTPSVLSIPATIDEYLNMINEAALKVK